MKLPVRVNDCFLFAVTMLLSSIFSVSAFAAGLTVDNTTITQVIINGGVDTVNPGTTCLQVSSPVSAACTGGFVAIPNNNKQLLAAALTAKATGSKIWLYYDNNAGSHHCPGITFTPCSIVSLSLK